MHDKLTAETHNPHVWCSSMADSNAAVNDMRKCQTVW